MQENNFEKQVQQKMEELKIDPSINVWQKVSLSITDRKRDRRIFYLFCLLFVAITAGTIFWWNNNKISPRAESAPKLSDKQINDNSKPIVDGKETKQADSTQSLSAMPVITEEVANSANSNLSTSRTNSRATIDQEEPNKPGIGEKKLSSSKIHTMQRNTVARLKRQLW
jgi:hypothetical protein